MVNFGLLAAEIDPVVWDTPANFIGFRVLAALLYSSQVVIVSQTLRRWTEGATYVRPHSSLIISHSNITFFIFRLSQGSIATSVIGEVREVHTTTCIVHQ